MTGRHGDAADFVFLSEALDALDRFYDGQSHVVDVAAILTVAGTAMERRSLGSELLVVAERMRDVIRSQGSSVSSGDELVVIAESLRGPVAQAWSDLSLRYGPGS